MEGNFNINSTKFTACSIKTHSSIVVILIGNDISTVIQLQNVIVDTYICIHDKKNGVEAIIPLVQSQHQSYETMEWFALILLLVPKISRLKIKQINRKHFRTKTTIQRKQRFTKIL